MAMFKFEQLENNIFYFTDTIPETKKLVKFIDDTDYDDSIKENSISKWRTWYASNDKTTIYGQQKMIDLSYIKKSEEISSRVLFIVNSIRRPILKCTEMYKSFLNIDGEVKLDDQFGINRYFKDAEMGPHADQADGNLSLRYSIVTYLNDDYEGGEIEFPNQSIKIKPVAGSSIIFPSSAPYLHRSHKIISGKKYMCPSFWLW